MQFVRMTAEHAMSLVDLEQIHSGFELDEATALDLEDIGGTTAIINGKVVGVAGILPQWRGVGLAWAWLGRGWRAEARIITDHIRFVLDSADFHRIEAAVRVDYGRGHRWMKALGFSLETPLARKWGPDGMDYSLYARVK